MDGKIYTNEVDKLDSTFDYSVEQIKRKQWFFDLNYCGQELSSSVCFFLLFFDSIFCKC